MLLKNASFYDGEVLKRADIRFKRFPHRRD